jgi:hypothetical protein
MIKRKLLSMMAITVFMAIIAFTGSVFAQMPFDIGAQEQTGNTILFNYYDIRTTAQGGPGLSDNYFTVTTDTCARCHRGEYYEPWTNAHVRVRTGQCSVELLDFDVILSPGDVFTFDLYQTATGSTQFASCDTDTLVASGFNVDSNGCYVLDSSTFPDMLGLIKTCGNCPDGSGAPLSDADALAATRWGYVEVIGEAILSPSDVDPDENCSKEKLAAGEYTLWGWVEEDGCDYGYVESDLFGRVYYARFDADRNLVRLATANGLSRGYAVCGGDSGGHSCSHVIVHRPCYSDTSLGCNVGDGELENTNYYVADDAKYAYAAASTDANPAGADDMNYCFYKNTITTSGDVVNKVGAAATFGPTLADLYDGYYAPRDGIAGTTVSIIYQLAGDIAKYDAISHYFYIPGQGQTRYVFTFPFQHFINQSITITKEERFNNEEETCAIPTGKFISPGLPVAGVPRGEVTILATQEPGDPCTFNEGWLEFSLLVTQDGVVGGKTNYPPGVIGMVVNYGDGDTADVMATAPMQWYVSFPFGVDGVGN